MADNKNTSRRSAPQGSRQQSAPRRSADASGSKSASPRRGDVIRCERCGEDYSVTYKRCPFCDERPSRGGISGRRVAEHSGPVNPIQVITVAVSLIVIIAALFIVFTYIGPLLFGNSDSGGSSQIDSSQTGGSGDLSQTGGGSGSGASDPGAGSDPGGGDVSQPADPSASVTSIALNRTDCTLRYGEPFTMEASLTPAGTGAQVTWSSSDPAVLSIDAEGNIKNQNSGTSTVAVTVTAVCGDQTATCVVRCRPAQSESEEPDEPDSQPSGGLAPNTQATVVNAGSGLNVRSGPGTSYDKVASLSNGNKVIVVEAAADGWYCIDYGNGQTGYVLGDYLSAG